MAMMTKKAVRQLPIESRRAIASELGVGGKLWRGESHRFYSDAARSNKDKQRSVILRHLLDTLDDARCIKLLSMPAENWDLENAVLSHTNNCRFVAFEQNTGICERSFLRMPTSSRLRSKVVYNRWRSAFGYYTVYQVDPHAHLFNADVCDFLDGSLNPVAWKSKTRWAKISTGVSAVWLDPFSPLGSPFYERCLKHLASKLEPTASLCFSFMLGRDSGHLGDLIKLAPGSDALQKRAEVLQLKLRQHGVEFSVSDTHRYKTANDDAGLYFGTVLGTATLGEANP